MRVVWRDGWRPDGIAAGVAPLDWSRWVAFAAGAPLVGPPRELYTRAGWSVTLALAAPDERTRRLHAFYAPFDEVLHAWSAFPKDDEAQLAALAERFLAAELEWEEARIVALADL